MTVTDTGPFAKLDLAGTSMVTVRAINDAFGLGIDEKKLDLSIRLPNNRVGKFGDLTAENFVWSMVVEELEELAEALDPLIDAADYISYLLTGGEASEEESEKKRAWLWDSIRSAINNGNDASILQIFLFEMGDSTYEFPSGVTFHSVAELIRSKKAEIARENIKRNWVEIFGVEAGAFSGDPYAIAVLSSGSGTHLFELLSEVAPASTICSRQSGSLSMRRFAGLWLVSKNVYDAWRGLQYLSSGKAKDSWFNIDVLRVLPEGANAEAIAETAGALISDGDCESLTACQIAETLES